MPTYRVMLAQFPGNFQTHPEPAGWMAKTHVEISKDARIAECVPWRLSDTPITMTRNKCIRVAQQIGVDYVLMIDNDVQPDCEPDGKPFWKTTWEFMLAHRDVPCAVAAPYVGPPDYMENIYCFRWSNRRSHNPEQDWCLEQFTRDEAGVRGGMEEAGALATGLILYDMRVFREMKPPWYYYEWADEYQDQKHSTEDVVQTRDMSLAWYMSGGKMGGKIFINWDSWAAHIKLKHCRKPRPMNISDVGENLRKAAALRMDHGDKLVLVGQQPKPRFPNAKLENGRWTLPKADVAEPIADQSGRYVLPPILKRANELPKTNDSSLNSDAFPNEPDTRSPEESPAMLGPSVRDLL